MEKLEKKCVAWYMQIDRILADNFNPVPIFAKKRERN
jgi:hypothetical protein